VLVTQAEFARLAGVSRSAIKQAIDNKLITALSVQNGKTFIEKTEGLQQYTKNSRRQKASQKSKPLQSPEPTGLGLLSWGQSPVNLAAVQQSDQPSSSESPPLDPSETPDFNTERAWTEYEKKLKLQVERELLEGKLVYREDIEQAQKAVALTLQSQALSLPQQIKNQIPHLTVEEQDIISKLVNQFLQNVADWEFADQEVEG
jgi:hypothetical protein